MVRGGLGVREGLWSRARVRVVTVVMTRSVLCGWSVSVGSVESGGGYHPTLSSTNQSELFLTLL